MEASIGLIGKFTVALNNPKQTGNQIDSVLSIGHFTKGINFEVGAWDISS